MLYWLVIVIGNISVKRKIRESGKVIDREVEEGGGGR